MQNYYEPPEPKISLPIAAQFCTDLKSQSYNFRSELDAIGTLIHNPEVEAVPSVPMLPPKSVSRNSRPIRSLYELSGDQPIPELVGSPVFLRPVERRRYDLGEMEDYRRMMRMAQRARSNTLMRDII